MNISAWYKSFALLLVVALLVGCGDNSSQTVVPVDGDSSQTIVPFDGDSSQTVAPVEGDSSQTVAPVDSGNAQPIVTLVSQQPVTDQIPPVHVDESASAELSSALLVPTNANTPLFFDSISDDRVMRWKTDDNYIATVFGSKNSQGELIGINEVVFVSEEYPTATLRKSKTSIELISPNAQYFLSANLDGTTTYRIEVEEQFVEYILPRNLFGSFVPDQNSFNRSKKIAIQPRQVSPGRFVDIVVDGCTAEISRMSLRAYNESGQFVDYFTPTQIAQNEYRAQVRGVSETGEKFNEFLSDVKRFFDEDDEGFLNGITADAAFDFGDTLLENAISTETDKIIDLEDLDDWQLPGTVNLDSVDSQIKRTVLQMLRRVLDFSNRVVFVSNLLPLIEAGQSVADFAIAVNFAQVAFDVAVVTNDGERITTIRSDSQPVDRALPNMRVVVPCKEVDINSSYLQPADYSDGFCSTDLFNNAYRVPHTVVVGPNSTVTVNANPNVLTPNSPNRTVGLQFNSTMSGLTQTVDNGAITLTNNSAQSVIVSGLTVVLQAIEPIEIELGSVVEKINFPHTGRWINFDAEIPSWMPFSCANTNEYSLMDARLTITPNSDVIFNVKTSGDVTSGGSGVGCFNWAFPEVEREHWLTGSCSSKSLATSGISSISLSATLSNVAQTVDVTFSERYDLSTNSSTGNTTLEGDQQFMFGVDLVGRLGGSNK